MKVLSIAFKDLQIFLKNRGAVVQLFLLPLLFIIVFSGALGGIGGGEEDTRLPLPVVDLDRGEAAQALLTGLDMDGGVRIVRYEQEEAWKLLDKNEIDRVLTIPGGFSADFAESRQVTLRLVNHPDANPEQTEAVRLAIDGVSQDMSLEGQLLASLQQMGDMQANAARENQVFTTERILSQARSQFARAQTQPLVALTQRVPSQDETQEESPMLEDVAVPGFTVLFVFLTAQLTARSIYEEKRVGSFRRLLAAPISKVNLILGKLLPNFITGVIQATVIFAFGIFGLRLFGLTPVPFERAPLGVILVVLLTALCSSALGIVIAAIARTENQIGGLSSLLLWGMGLIGGSIAPLFLLERFLGPIPKIVPHYWANRAFDSLLIRGLGLAGVTTELVVLMSFTMLFFLVGLWQFDYD